MVPTLEAERTETTEAPEAPESPGDGGDSENPLKNHVSLHTPEWSSANYVTKGIQ